MRRALRFAFWCVLLICVPIAWWIDHEITSAGRLDRTEQGIPIARPSLSTPAGTLRIELATPEDPTGTVIEGKLLRLGGSPLTARCTVADSKCDLRFQLIENAGLVGIACYQTVGKPDVQCEPFTKQ